MGPNVPPSLLKAAVYGWGGWGFNPVPFSPGHHGGCASKSNIGGSVSGGRFWSKTIYYLRVGFWSITLIPVIRFGSYCNAVELRHISRCMQKFRCMVIM